MEHSIDINCDVGEGFANEEELMPYLSSCSVACGAHAGDENTIRETISLALEHQVKVGAHPSFPDKENFGRVIMNMNTIQLQKSIENQINSVQNALFAQNGENLHHVKMHGALYNLSAVDLKMAKLVIKAFSKTTSDAFLYVPYNSVIHKMALESNIKIKVEAFADRNYNSDLTLVSRNNSNAVLTDSKNIAAHLLKMILEKKVICADGVEVKIEAQTYCFHGDNFGVENNLKFIHEILSKNKIKIV